MTRVFLRWLRERVACSLQGHPLRRWDFRTKDGTIWESCLCGKRWVWG